MSQEYVRLVVELGAYLRSEGYAFTTVTPLTHQRVLRNCGNITARDLCDAFGWNLPFDEGLVPSRIRDPLLQAGWLTRIETGLFRSSLRFGSLGNDLFAHSGFPTAQEDAVFFGPDTYRFATLIAGELARCPLAAESRVLDMGCGGGPGGIAVLRANDGQVQELVLADINPGALALSQANANLANVLERCNFLQSDLFTRVDGVFDLIVSNPPYLVDAAKRTYRHGGGDFGEELSQRILEQSIVRLSPGGRLILYTGSAVVRGLDPFCEWAERIATHAGCSLTRREIDPDVFGEELDRPEYKMVDRIAAVGLVVGRPIE